MRHRSTQHPATARSVLAASVFTAVSVLAILSPVGMDRGALAVQDAGEAALPDGAFAPRRGLQIRMRSRDGQLLVGAVQWYNREGLAYADRDGASHEVGWADLDPENLGAYMDRVPDRRDAGGQLLIAEAMIANGVDDKMVERTLTYAVRADPAAEARATLLRESMTTRDAEPMPAEPADNAPGEEAPAEDGQPAAANNPRAWPQMTAEQHEQAVRDLETFVDEALVKMGHVMDHTQTKRFLVYSDMDRDESRYWVSLLDRMYDRLCEVFSLDKQTNIWHGKCLLMFFRDREDFVRFNAAAYNSTIEGAAGICRQFGNGDVHISMYRQPDKTQLADVLVHEAAHGFLGRYQSSYHVKSWLNEGLAEYIAQVLVESGSAVRGAQRSRTLVRESGRIGDFLSATNIKFEHYGMAYDITEMMIEENREGYVELIRGIKAGLSVEEAFEQRYGASIQRVFQYYARNRLNMDNLRLD